MAFLRTIARGTKHMPDESDDIVSTKGKTRKGTKAVEKRRAKSSPQARASSTEDKVRTRTARPYPVGSFEESLLVAEAIYKMGDDRVRRLTLLRAMDKSPTSSATRMIITNSGKYGLTTGSYAGEYIELTPLGKQAVSNEVSPKDKLAARFKLAIEKVVPFEFLYSQYKGKRLPAHEVLSDTLAAANLGVDDLRECIDNFVVNANYLGLLQTIAGAETLIPIDQALEEAPQEKRSAVTRIASAPVDAAPIRDLTTRNWDKICFFMAPIGEEGSEARRHSDLFLGHLIEPALRDFGLEVVRADKIGEAGMITTQIIEFILRARLAIVDLSFHNPNAFYEMALRHATKLPVVQLIRKQDRLPFDVNQVRTVIIDTTDIYSLVPKLETYRSEIAAQVRAVLDGNTAGNPISVFFPGFEVTIPREK